MRKREGKDLNNRLLCIMYTMSAGGAESMIMKLYREASKCGIVFDFLLLSDKKGFYDDEIKSLGGTLFYLGNVSLKKDPISFFMALVVFFRKHKYTRVLQSTEQSYLAIYALLARLLGSEIVAIRSINSTTCRGRIWDIVSKMTRFIPKIASNVKFAPSQVSADFLFGDSNVHILRNGVKIEKFGFNEFFRKKHREELMINDGLIIGHVGRFSKQKNHKFLLDVFAEIIALEKNSILLLLGNGELENNIKQYAMSLGIIDKIVFAGVREDVPELMMAMDVLVFPSFYEGLPNVVIEAQTTGLPCVVSDTITDECKVTDKVEFLSLKNHPQEWALKALSMIDKNDKRENYAVSMKVAGYDIQDVAKEFLTYMKLEI